MEEDQSLVRKRTLSKAPRPSDLHLIFLAASVILVVFSAEEFVREVSGIRRLCFLRRGGLAPPKVLPSLLMIRNNQDINEFRTSLRTRYIFFRGGP